MNPTPTLIHHHGDHIAVAAPGTGVELLRYVYRPEAAWEASKPYIHPLRTLSGRAVTGYRPNDHRWHKGLQMTASHLSGQNLWGGNSYVHGEGYRALPDRVGSMAHRGFDAVAARDGSAVLTERLTWHPYTGETWADELRRVEVHAVDPAAGSWALTWSTSVTNRREEPLRFGSPGTAGREGAGYTGLFWRGPRAFAGGTLLAPGGARGPGLMGHQSPWLAFTGEHDDEDGHATLVFAHAPENDHTGAAGTHPAHWFARTQGYPGVAPSFAFHRELVLDPGDSLVRRYRVLVADGALDEEDIEGRLAEIPW
ncbi:PmoA family protein [uncultured Streptomyces sp.]|uniref:DUF6807 domain-containing protein n=1 Tax=uncultured Streptomyces sp. TaxID=174707 RepID=UPI002625C40A|nr:PmoA family protein [uncultured Streptomyces sp.]